MKKLISFLVLYFISTPSFPQSNWQEVLQIKNSNQLKKIIFINESTGYVIGNFLLKTTDAGISWLKLDSNKTFHDIQFVDESNGFLIYSENNVFYFCRTIDGGNSWMKNMTYIRPNKLSFINEYTGFMSQDYITNNILKTTDAGNSWSKIPTNVLQSTNGGTRTFRQIKFINELDGYSIIHSGPTFPSSWSGSSFYKTSDGGATWRYRNMNEAHLVDLIINDNFLYAYGGVVTPAPYLLSGDVFRSTDFGENWTKLNGSEDSYINKLTKVGSNFYACITGYILNSTDNCTTWNTTLGMTKDVYFPDMIFIKENLAIALLDSYTLSKSAILRSTDAGVTNISQINNEFLDKYFLYQNYPNPFNPSTTISYSLKENSDVTLKVFDVTGKLVATLVNKKQSAGVYNFQLSMDNYQLMSGVYFYQLRANDFVQTKKMFLIK